VSPRRARVLRDQQAGQHPQALRRHLIQVTQRLLAAHGLAGLTTRTIAREAQVSDGVLYNHFADKDDLVVAALAERTGELLAGYAAGFPEPGAQDLGAGFAVVVRRCREFLAEALPLVGGLLGRPDLVHALLTRIHSGEAPVQLLWGRIVGFVEAEQERGAVAADVDARTVAEIIFGACQLNVFTWLLRDAVPLPAEHTAPGPDDERLVAFLLRACSP
jgi:AcrR family transcriptional regulator